MPKMTKVLSISVLLSLILLTGCSSKIINPISYSPAIEVEQENTVIGVVSSAIPQPEMVYPGASCLLCLGAAAAMNSTLSSYSETLDASELGNLKREIVELLQAQGKNAAAISENIITRDLNSFASESLNTPHKDYREFAKKAGVTHLIVLDFYYAGIQRNYSGYIPTSNPFAKVSGKAMMVDTKTNELFWYLPLDIELLTQGEWDEPKTFPGLTNAFYQAIATARERILEPFRTASQGNDVAQSGQ